MFAFGLGCVDLLCCFVFLYLRWICLLLVFLVCFAVAVDFLLCCCLLCLFDLRV